MPLHTRNQDRDDLLDDLYASSDLSVVMPKYRIPADEHAAAHAFAVVRDELMLDGNAQDESGDLLPDVGRAGNRQAHGVLHRQEHDRQGRVSANGGTRIALCPHASPFVERARVGQYGRLLDDRIERGGHAGRTGHEVALAAIAPEGRKAGRPAEPDHRAGASLLAQVRPLLRRRDPRSAHGCWAAAADARRSLKARATKTQSAWCPRWE